ncbi:MAG: hypothetical protein HY727_15170 [Candidatus Rokubacteria bacterium]|nr:hypothetical protein [Candidatus Rokubacteria bacterium]
MLRDFILPITLAGAPRGLIARDLPAGLFFYGFPDIVPFADCWERDTSAGQRETAQQMERWLDHLLVAAVCEPRLTLEQVHRLGPARDEAVVAYLRTVGWLTERDVLVGERTMPIELAPAPSVEDDPPPIAAWVLRAVVQTPGQNVRQALRMMAERTRTLPSVLWQLPISEWIFCWRVLLSDKLQEREARRHRDD